MARKKLYPGTAEAEEERIRASRKPPVPDDEEPDWLGNAPNYEKFRRKFGWDTETTLVKLNID